uniref:FANCI_S3 domain-containing protein n=1 Tax=Glossina brevipalpis TaxID=37001 RepID=A0A1A9W6Q9_9MUSC
MLWKEFDLTSASLATQCFRQCLNTANKLYKNKFSDVFVRSFDVQAVNKNSECILVLQNTIQTYIQEELSDHEESMFNASEGCNRNYYNIRLGCRIVRRFDPTSEFDGTAKDSISFLNSDLSTHAPGTDASNAVNSSAAGAGLLSSADFEVAIDENQ